MRTLLVLAALVLAAAAPSAGASDAVTVTLVVDPDPTTLGLAPATCDVTVPAGANGVAVLDRAKANGCILSYRVSGEGPAAFLECVNEQCMVCPPPWLLCAYWAFYLGDDYSSVGIGAYGAAEGDVVRFAYDAWPLSG